MALGPLIHLEEEQQALRRDGQEIRIWHVELVNRECEVLKETRSLKDSAQVGLLGQAICVYGCT